MAIAFATARDRGDAQAKEALLSLDGLAVVYNRAIHGLRGVSFTVPRGSIVALLGPNGSGKTTALRAISGLIGFHRGRVTAGQILYDGTPFAGSAAQRVRSGIAQVMEGRRIFAELSIQENLLAGSFTVRSKARVSAALETVYSLFPLLADRRAHIAGYLSGGQQQMLAIGRALMSGPKLLLLDEPSLGLAPLVVDQIARTISEINAMGTSVLLVEQNAAVALRIAHFGVILETGRVALMGEASALRLDPKVRDVYLGMAGHERRYRADTLSTAGKV